MNKILLSLSVIAISLGMTMSGANALQAAPQSSDQAKK